MRRSNAAAGVLFVFAASLSVSLSACSGAVGTTPAPATPLPNVRPSQRPIVDGAVYEYGGVIDRTIQRPLPAPSATQPPYRYRASVSERVRVDSPASFGTAADAADFHGATTVAGIPLQTAYTTDDYYRVEGTGDVRRFVLLGSTLRDRAPNVEKSVPGAGNGLIDLLPERAGQRWSNTAALAYDETDAGGTSATRSVARDGAYVEHDAFPGGQSATIDVRADGSGVYAFTDYRGQVDVRLVFSPPSGTTPEIAIAGVPFEKNQTWTTKTITVPAWYARGAPLWKETNVDAGRSALPKRCGVRVKAPAPNRIVQTIERLDPVLGYTERTATSSYVAAGYGVVCTVTTDRIVDYYDYTGQAGDLDSGAFSGSAQQITATVTTLGMTSASAPSTAARPDNAVAVAARDRILAIKRRALRRLAGRIEEFLR